MREHPSAWHEGGEHIHDEDGLKNHCSLRVIGIGPQHQKLHAGLKSELFCLENCTMVVRQKNNVVLGE